ncbi:MAG: thermonuclease family protein [Clostridia bacterium]|nr:thermonuclease family protein [Clostridia bacterium]
MKQALIAAAVLIISAFAGCRHNTDMDELIMATPVVQPTDISTETAHLFSLQLPEISDDMELYKDGYETVEFLGAADGDTAEFLINGEAVIVRMLAIDAPEMNSDEGLQPWAIASKEYLISCLEGAKKIVLEIDQESDIYDKYDRLLAWVWADGELINYRMVSEGFAEVKYLYGDYQYNEAMLKAQEEAQRLGLKIWSGEDPDYDYSGIAIETDIASARNMDIGTIVSVKGVITNLFGENAFIEDNTAAIHIYTNRQHYDELKKGAELQITGCILDYNGLLEISNIDKNGILLIAKGNYVEPKRISLSEVNEENEGKYIRIDDLTITDIVYTDGKKGYNVYVTGENASGVIRIDKYLEPYIEPEAFQIGDVIDVTGNVGQYGDMYQIMIGSIEDVSIKNRD